jgi:hypothetical protein
MFRCSRMPNSRCSQVATAALLALTAATIEDSKVRFGVAGSSSESKLPEMVVALIEDFLDSPNARNRKEIHDVAT